MPRIKASIAKDGSVKLDMEGYQGGSCHERAKRIVEALGTARDERPKDDDPVVTHEETATA